MGDADLKQDIARLLPGRADMAGLGAAKAPAPILGKTALGKNSAQSTANAGISSPITAESVTSESRTITSSDGLFSLVYDHWLDITCTDADGREVVIDLSALA